MKSIAVVIFIYNNNNESGASVLLQNDQRRNSNTCKSLPDRLDCLSVLLGATPGTIEIISRGPRSRNEKHKKKNTVFLQYNNKQYECIPGRVSAFLQRVIINQPLEPLRPAVSNVPSAGLMGRMGGRRQLFEGENISFEVCKKL